MNQQNYEITICLGTGCLSAGSNIIFKKFAEEIKAANLTNVALKPTGCHGFCDDIQITLTLQFEPQMIEALVVDSGDPFDKTAVATPILDEPQEGGYGLFLIEQLVDDFQYTRLVAGNQWQLKRIMD